MNHCSNFYNKHQNKEHRTQAYTESQVLKNKCLLTLYNWTFETSQGLGQNMQQCISY